MYKSIGLTAIILLACVSGSWAAGDMSLEQQVQELMQQNKMLLDRVQKLEEKLAGYDVHHREHAGHKGDGSGSLLEEIRENVEISGVVEIEAGFSEDYKGDETSDITLATVEVGLDAHITDWAEAHILFLYEEGEEDDHVIVDEGTITLGNPEMFPGFLTVGRMYLPFGSYASNMVSDTLPLELGETGDSGVQVGFESAGFYGSVYGFNGHINETGDDDHIDGFGASIGYTRERNGLAYDVGLDWINNIADSDGLGGYLEDDVGTDEIAEYVAGLAAHLFINYGPFNFAAEYLTSLDDFALGVIDFNGSGARPAAWSVEAGVTTELFSRETVFALGYQGTDESVALGLPEKRYLGAVRMMILNNTSLALEYLHDEDYDTGDGGTGDDARSATMQLAVEF